MIANGLEDGQPDTLRKVSAVIAPAAAARAPALTGALASSIIAAPTAKSARVFSPLPYAGPLHWGWPRHNIEANTFAVDAARATEALWVDTWTDGVQDLIDRSVVISGAAFNL